MLFIIDVKTEEDLNEALTILQNRHKVTGEFHIKPLGEDRGWRLSVHSEKKLRETTIEKLPGERVDGGS